MWNVTDLLCFAMGVFSAETKLHNFLDGWLVLQASDAT